MPEGLPDFTQVNNLTLDTFILNLKMRYESEQIYSYIGESLISVNPYEVSRKQMLISPYNGHLSITVTL